MSNTKILVFDFNLNSNISNWQVVDDVVMGGKSSGKFTINKQGNGEFSGFISLENNGGFSLLRHRFKKIEIKGATKIVLRVKGGANKYQFRVKDNVSNYYSYTSVFSIEENKWQNITIPLKEMYPVFRGRKLDENNFSSNKIEEIAFLIGNKVSQNFKLEIKTIFLQ